MVTLLLLIGGIVSFVSGDCVSGAICIGILLLWAVFLWHLVKGTFDTPRPSGIKVYDADCPICHGTGQGNGGYTGDSGECSCGHWE